MKKEIILASFLLSMVSGLENQAAENIYNVHARHLVLLSSADKNWLCIGYLISLNQVLTSDTCMNTNHTINVRPILNLENDFSLIRKVKKIYMSKNLQEDHSNVIIMELNSSFPRVKEFEPITLKLDQESVKWTSCEIADISIRSRLKRELLGADLEIKQNQLQDNLKTQSPLKDKIDETKLKRNDASVPLANKRKITNTTEGRIIRGQPDGQRQVKGSEASVPSESLKPVSTGNSRSSKHHQTEPGLNKTTTHREKKTPTTSTDASAQSTNSFDTTNKIQSTGKPDTKDSTPKKDYDEANSQTKAGNNTDEKNSPTETVIPESEVDKKNRKLSSNYTSNSTVDNFENVTNSDSAYSAETVDLANNNSTVDKENSTAFFDSANDNASTVESLTPDPTADENLLKRLYIVGKAKPMSEVPRENNFTIHHEQHTVSLVVSKVEMIDTKICDQRPDQFHKVEDSNVLCVKNKFCLKKQDGDYWNSLTSGGKLIGMFDHKTGQEECRPYRMYSLKKWKDLIECAQNEHSCLTSNCKNICNEEMCRTNPLPEKPSKANTNRKNNPAKIPQREDPLKREKESSHRNRGTAFTINKFNYIQLVLCVFFFVL